MAYDEYTQTGFDAFLAANPVTGAVTQSLSALNQAKQFIKNLESQFEHLLGIGVGRNEANLITPYQNLLVSAPGAPLGIINTAYALVGDVSHDNADDLNQIYQVVKQAVDAFYRYIGYPTFPKEQWPDGRASQQAYATIQPYADKALAMLKDRLIAAGGVLHPIANTSAAGPIGAQLQNKLAQVQSIGSGSSLSSPFRGIGGNSSVLLVGVIISAVFALALSGKR